VSFHCYSRITVRHSVNPSADKDRPLTIPFVKFQESVKAIKERQANQESHITWSTAFTRAKQQNSKPPLLLGKIRIVLIL